MNVIKSSPEEFEKLYPYFRILPNPTLNPDVNTQKKQKYLPEKGYFQDCSNPDKIIHIINYVAYYNNSREIYSIEWEIVI